MKLGKWALAGAAGGLVGALVWAGLVAFAHVEIGYLAWGIGAIVGFCVRLAAGGEDEGVMPGVTAVVVALGAITFGKFLGASMLVSNAVGDMSPPVMTANEMIVHLADGIIEERQAKGQTVVMPNGIALEDATTEADYPPDVWRAAVAKWNAIPVADQQKQIDTRNAMMQGMFAAQKSEFRSKAFLGSFSPFDALWFLLAAGTAYKLGAGNVGDDD